MSDAAELLTVVDAVIIALRRHAIPYFVTGSFASSIHGEFRATADIDLVADMHPAVLPALLQDLQVAFVADLEQATSSLAAGMSFNLIHRTTYLKVDFFPCNSAFDRSALARAVTIEVPGALETLRVSSLEDILLGKLQWYRLGGESSAMQLRDIRRLIELNRDELDTTYLRQWSAVIGVDDLLTSALA